ncbi:Protein SCO1/2 [Candidatus Methylobacter favarea]|uniref:Protein SCO1/2 n=1 Tax=Candidatus Methylobacter favarea TaxID=2707345 RepID=A0A8S0XHZ8_9GAMM|nr:SCO family protein [Candidatus Methylobacter favarea]CAA9892203.1 Protein SCO1/2 [Candidatus Methylobacter favarea]
MSQLTGPSKYFRLPPYIFRLIYATASARFLIGIALASGLTSCNSEPAWHLNNISGHLPDLEFALISDKGMPVTAQTFKGRLIVMYFGFTHCAAECPVAMARLSQVLQKLGKDADRVHILFVTLDPGRDTSPVLHRYLSAFNAAHMTGLTGNKQAIIDLVKRYRSAYRPATGGGKSNDIAHSAAVYIFDAQGQARLLFSPAEPDKNLVSDLLRLLHESR